MIGTLEARQAVVDVVVQYATGVDRRDWSLYGACFTDPCEIDFSSWTGRPGGVVSRDDWVKRVRSTNGNFDATQHMSTNHVVTFATDDEATCVSYVQAQHWFSAERLAALGQSSPAPRWCTVGGYYTNSLVRSDGGWQIRRCELNVKWITGDRTVFDLARSLGDPG
jgi:hypothetical protein